LNICVEKCANSKRLWKLAKENGNISLEMQAKVYESRLQKLENEQDNFNIMKQRITVYVIHLIVLLNILGVMIDNNRFVLYCIVRCRGG
jgi:hypothetical protein